ncbi:hypothetical protein IWQ57_001657 [Coemansia nantahalensis]|uniref:Uncharacterized protein n=1 Tax=Coemansia nantahalensis TaxID=2789366 RepID=A0ACC1K3K8_9FUNG|nr:hypothetical protein IWQ57_001657 [Coemansia nantahalensis]
MVIDKSAAIRDIMNREEPIVAGLYPHRMGKSMFLGMLADFLGAVSDTPYSERRARYEQYAVYQEDPEFFNSNIGRYVVFNLDMKYISEGDLFDICDMIPTLMEVFYLLFDCKSVVIVDGYDAPFINTLLHPGDWEMTDGQLEDHKEFFSGILEDNPHLHKGILAGVFDVRSSSLESVLNSIPTFLAHTGYTDNMANPFQRAFGFTVQDVWAVINQYVDQLWPARNSCTDVWRFKARVFAGLLLQSDGYRIGTVHRIFCPFSVMAFLEQLDRVTTATELAFDSFSFWCETDHLDRDLAVDTSSVHDMARYLRHLATAFDRQREFQRTSSLATRLGRAKCLNDNMIARIASQPSEQNELGYSDDTEAELVRICTVDSSGLIDELLEDEDFSAATVVQVLYQAGYLAPVAQHRMGIPSKATYDKVAELSRQILPDFILGWSD